MIEIERKFLVKEHLKEELENQEFYSISQGYLVNEKSKSVRVRIRNDKAFLTIKSGMTGISRNEYEYAIPESDARSLIESLNIRVLTKKRYHLTVFSKLWEIDVFEGKLGGLVIAEIELKSEDEEFEFPGWLGKEVTHDPAYLNANLINRL